MGIKLQFKNNLISKKKNNAVKLHFKKKIHFLVYMCKFYVVCKILEILIACRFRHPQLKKKLLNYTYLSFFFSF
jgi:hypothetical protein